MSDVHQLQTLEGYTAGLIEKSFKNEIVVTALACYK